MEQEYDEATKFVLKVGTGFHSDW